MLSITSASKLLHLLSTLYRYTKLSELRNDKVLNVEVDQTGGVIAEDMVFFYHYTSHHFLFRLCKIFFPIDTNKEWLAFLAVNRDSHLYRFSQNSARNP